MSTAPSRTIYLKCRTRTITVRVSEETESYYVGVQIATHRYPKTVFPKDVWEEVEESEGNAA